MNSVEDLRHNLEALTSDQFVSQHIFERIPFLFQDDWQSYRSWTKKAALLLDVDPKNVAVVGSGACGYSLNPHKDFKKFGQGSDIDLAVISTHHFDLAWRTLRRTHLSKAQNRAEREAIEDHRKRLVYWGCIATDKVLRFLPFSSDWGHAAIQLSGTEPANGRVVNFRLYKDYDALREYQINSVAGVK